MKATTTPDLLEDPRKLRLMNWLTTPPAEREPDSQNKIAIELGVTPRTIRDWKANPSFRALWEKQAKDIIGDPERVQMVLEKMYQHCLDDASAKQAKAWDLYLKATDSIKPPAIDLAAKKAAELTDAELEALIAEAAQREVDSRLNHT